MQQPLTLIQKIDEVLKIIASKEPPNDTGIYTYKSAYRILQEIQQIDESTQVSEFTMILKKLLKDEYVECLQDAAGLLTTQWRDLHFYKTFDGELFVQSGGYTQKFINDDLEIQRNRAISSYPLGLNRLTFSLVLATALLVAIEWIKMTHDYRWWPFCK
jgi:hypothetical protein